MKGIFEIKIKRITLLIILIISIVNIMGCKKDKKDDLLIICEELYKKDYTVEMYYSPDKYNDQYYGMFGLITVDHADREFRSTPSIFIFNEESIAKDNLNAIQNKYKNETWCRVKQKSNYIYVGDLEFNNDFEGILNNIKKCSLNYSIDIKKMFDNGAEELEIEYGEMYDVYGSYAWFSTEFLGQNEEEYEFFGIIFDTKENAKYYFDSIKDKDSDIYKSGVIGNIVYGTTTEGINKILPAIK